MTAAINRALEAAIGRTYALGRVDQSAEHAAEELRRMVEAEPGITPQRVLRRYGLASRWSNASDWDEALWRIADLWCEVYRGLQRRPARQLPASPYSALVYDAVSAQGAHRGGRAGRPFRYRGMRMLRIAATQR